MVSFLMLTLVSLSAVITITVLLTKKAKKTDPASIVSGVLLVVFSLMLTVAGATFGKEFWQGLPLWTDNSLTKNHIYEVLGAVPVDDKTWLVLKDQDGNSLVYQWEGKTPTANRVQATTDSGTPNGFLLKPCPPSATSQPVK